MCTFYLVFFFLSSERGRMKERQVAPLYCVYIYVIGFVMGRVRPVNYSFCIVHSGLCFSVNKPRVNNYLHVSDHLLCCLGPPNIGIAY
jgi:hypothetical protein